MFGKRTGQPGVAAPLRPAPAPAAETVDARQPASAAPFASAEPVDAAGAFALADADAVQLMQRVNDFEEQLDDGTWQMTIDFECTVYLAAGV